MCEKHAADYSFKMLPTVRITHCGHQSNNPIIISSSPTGKNMPPTDLALEILGNLDPEFITGCSKCLSIPHCQYTASLDLDTFLEVFRSGITGNYDCEKGLLAQGMVKFITWCNHNFMFLGSNSKECEVILWIHISHCTSCFNCKLMQKTSILDCCWIV